MFLVKMKKNNNKYLFLFLLTFGIFVSVRVTLFFVTANIPITRDIQTHIFKEEIHELTNEERSQRHGSTLDLNAQLTRAAQMKADNMASNGYFSHTDPRGRKFTYWLKNTGYDYSYAAENLAVNFINSDSIVKAWMNSSSHKKSLLSEKYSEFGLGVAAGQYKGQKAFYVVLMLAEPLIPLEYQHLF